MTLFSFRINIQFLFEVDKKWCHDHRGRGSRFVYLWTKKRENGIGVKNCTPLRDIIYWRSMYCLNESLSKMLSFYSLSDRKCFMSGENTLKSNLFTTDGHASCLFECLWKQGLLSINFMMTVSKSLIVKVFLFVKWPSILEQSQWKIDWWHWS